MSSALLVMTSSSSTSSSISSAERLFIRDGIIADVRNDGRQRLDFRYFTLKTGVLPSANGSCRLSLGGTQVLVGINAEIGEPDVDQPNMGRCVASVQFTASSTPDYESQATQTLAAQLTSDLSRLLISSHTLPLSSLCIIPGKQCWILYVDALILDNQGSVMDAIAMATKAAADTTTLPSIEVIGSPSSTSGETCEIVVSDDPLDCSPLDSSHLPIIISLTKIGTYFIIDATLEEEICGSVTLQVAVNRQGQIAGVHKTGTGGMAIQATNDMIKIARSIGMDMITRLEKVTKRSQPHINGQHDDSDEENS